MSEMARGVRSASPRVLPALSGNGCAVVVTEWGMKLVANSSKFDFLKVFEKNDRFSKKRQKRQISKELYVLFKGFQA